MRERPLRLGNPYEVTQEQIDSLKLTRQEKRELEAMPLSERREVLAYLVKKQKRRLLLDK